MTATAASLADDAKSLMELRRGMDDMTNSLIGQGLDAFIAETMVKAMAVSRSDGFSHIRPLEMHRALLSNFATSAEAAALAFKNGKPAEVARLVEDFTKDPELVERMILVARLATALLESCRAVALDLNKEKLDG